MVTFFVQQVSSICYSSNEMKAFEMGQACVKHGAEEKCMQGMLGKPEIRKGR
jgi:hypothetical protein